MDDKQRDIISKAKLANIKVQDALAKIDLEQRKYLESRGWVHTCATPGSMWLWTKNIKVSRSYRNPQYIKGPEGRGMVSNPDSDGWTHMEYVYDALMPQELAFKVQLTMDADKEP